MDKLKMDMVEGYVTTFKIESAFGFIWSATINSEVFFHVRDFLEQRIPGP
jgi:cold shock CspA family protein